MPTKKAATTKVKKSAPPPDILNEDEEKGPSSSQGDPAYKPTKKSSTKNVLAKKSTKESTAPMENEKCKSLEEHNLAKEDIPSSESTSKAVVASSKGKKRASTSIAQDSDSQPCRKRIKSGTTEIDPSLQQNSNLSGEAPLVTSKKRRRNPKDADSEVEDGMDKGTKRKKHSSPFESRQSPEITVEEDSVKPVAKRSRKVAKSTRKDTKKQSSDNSTTVTTSYVERLRYYKKVLNIFSRKRKENNAAMPKSTKVSFAFGRFPCPFTYDFSKVASKSGPPKSVLQRLKDSLGAQVVDNEPDPIDFLS